MKGIVEAHGGTVEKFIGDAVMAVFGVPVLHEAAAALKEALGRYERKRNLAMSRRVRERLAELQPA